MFTVKKRKEKKKKIHNVVYESKKGKIKKEDQNGFKPSKSDCVLVTVSFERLTKGLNALAQVRNITL